MPQWPVGRRNGVCEEQKLRGSLASAVEAEAARDADAAGLNRSVASSLEDSGAPASPRSAFRPAPRRECARVLPADCASPPPPSPLPPPLSTAVSYPRPTSTSPPPALVQTAPHSTTGSAGGGGGVHQPAGQPLRLDEQEAAVRSALHDSLRRLDDLPPKRQGCCSSLSGCRLEYCPCPYSDIFCLLLAQQRTLPPPSPSWTYRL